MEKRTRLLISSGYHNAAAYLFTDVLNPVEFAKEMMDLDRAHDKYINSEPYTGRPLFEMIKSVTTEEKEEDLDGGKPSSGDHAEQCLEELEVARKAVLEHYGEEDHKLYGQFIVSCVEEMAKSSGGGWLGLGSEYTDVEKKHVQKLRDMFNLDN